MSIQDARGALHGENDGRYQEKSGTRPGGGLAGGVGQPAESDEHVAAFEAAAAAQARIRWAEEDRWGTLNITEDSMTPWGKPNHVYDVAAGIAEISGVGHGGVKLSAERNKLIHPALRNSSGWYEEDCEWNIPAAAFADEWVAHRNPDGTATGMFASADALRESANDSIRSWFPDQFEKATGQKVLPGPVRRPG